MFIKWCLSNISVLVIVYFTGYRNSSAVRQQALVNTGESAITTGSLSICQFTNLCILNSTFFTLQYTPIFHLLVVWILQILDVFVHIHVHVLHKWMTNIAVIFLNLRHWMHFKALHTHTHTNTHINIHIQTNKQQHCWKQ